MDKSLTQIIPALLPLRKWQRKNMFYLSMRFDGRRYASNRDQEPLPHRVFVTSQPLYNTRTGFDMKYQENKVFNLRLAAKPLDGLVIRPGETFSFWKTVRNADRHVPYRDGLTVENGKLGVANGGGLCQMSNLLFWLFLHSPLDIVERHGHCVRDFPDASTLKGVDATIYEGWKDLKVYNGTSSPMQIRIVFMDDTITGYLLSREKPSYRYEVVNSIAIYRHEEGHTVEEVQVRRRNLPLRTSIPISDTLLYTNRCIIGYPIEEIEMPKEGVTT